jgi:hypothetical protein
MKRRFLIWRGPDEWLETIARLRSSVFNRKFSGSPPCFKEKAAPIEKVGSQPFNSSGCREEQE